MQRVAQAWLDMAANTGVRNKNGSQVKETHKEAIGNALFHEPLLLSSSHDGFILVRDMTFAFLSEMTLLPTFGKCHIAYSPRNGTIVGLSKLSRVTKSVSGALQTPQRFAAELLSVIQEEVGPVGIAVVAECNVFDSDVFCKENNASAAKGAIRKEIALSTFGSLSSDSVSEVLALLNVDLRDSVPSISHHPIRESSAREPTEAVLEDQRVQAMIKAVRTLLEGIGEDPDRLDLSGSPGRYVKWLTQATGGYSIPAVVPRLHCCSGNCDETASKSLENIQLNSTVFYAKFGPESDSDIIGCVQPDVASDASSCDIVVSMEETPSNPQMDTPKELSHYQRPHHDSPPIQRMPCSTVSNSAQLIRVPFTSQCEHHLLPFYGSIVVARRMTVDISTESLQRVCELVVDRFSRRLQVQERLTNQVADAILTIFPQESFMVFCSCKHMCMVARGVEEHCSSTASMSVRGMASWVKQPKARVEFLQAIKAMQIDCLAI